MESDSCPCLSYLFIYLESLLLPHTSSHHPLSQDASHTSKPPLTIPFILIEETLEKLKVKEGSSWQS